MVSENVICPQNYNVALLHQFMMELDPSLNTKNIVESVENRAFYGSQISKVADALDDDFESVKNQKVVKMRLKIFLIICIVLL